MGASLRVATVAGIDIKLHWSFFIVILWAVGQGLSLGGGRAILFSLVTILLLFFFVTLHELGHALVALQFEIQVRDIVLLPIGGVAQLRNLPEKSWQELVIALAGPAVNFALAALAGLVLLLVSGPGLMAQLFSPSGTLLRNLYQGLSGGGNVISIAVWVLFVNLILALFNLFPAFPMDGGRVLRAFLALFISFPRATRLAVRVGQGLAILMALLAIRGNFSLLFIALFVFVGASYEDQIVRTRWAMRQLRIADVLPARSLIRIRSEQSLSEVMALSFRWAQRDFPVFQNGVLLGLLFHNDLIDAVQAGHNARPIAWLIRRDLPRMVLSDTLWKVQRAMAEANVTALPIFHEGQFVNLISYRDIKQAYLGRQAVRQ